MPAPNEEVIRSQDSGHPPVSKAIRTLAGSALGLSAALLVGLALCFLARWDVVAVITLPPFWAWGIVGLFLTAVGWWLARGGWRAPVLLAVWVAAILCFSDDIQGWLLSPLRSGAGGSSPRTGVRLRVVSLNCAGQVKAGEEVGALKPDIVFAPGVSLEQSRGAALPGVVWVQWQLYLRHGLLDHHARALESPGQPTFAAVQLGRGHLAGWTDRGRGQPAVVPAGNPL